MEMAQKIHNKTELQQTLGKIEHEALTAGTLDDCLKVLNDYRHVMEQETTLPASEFSSVDKFNIDYLTWKFSFIFDRASEKHSKKKLEGYDALARLNENTLDYSHVGKEFSPFTRLAELYALDGEQRKAKESLTREKERKEKLEQSESFFHKGVQEHRSWNIKAAAASYQECLKINPFHTKARVLLGFLYSTSIVLEKLFQKPGKEMLAYSGENPGGIPLIQPGDSEIPPGFEINLGVNFQSQYYRKKNPEDLTIFFEYDGFGESNNRVIKYVRDFSEELEKLMVDYSPLLKRSALKFYRKEKREEAGLFPSELERIGLKYFGEKRGMNVPRIEREPAKSEGEFLELKLIEGMSMYDLLRIMEWSDFSLQLKADFSPQQKEAIADALVRRQIQDLVEIQNSTAKLRHKSAGTVVKKPEYHRKLREAFEEKEDPPAGKAGGLIVLMKKHFKLGLSYPSELDEVGKELDKIVGDEEQLVVYKDASPRNTKIDFRGVAREMGLVGARETKDIVKTVLEECEKESPRPERLAQAFAYNLYQLDFEKIDRLAHEFDDLVEIIECPYFNPDRNGEQRWEEMYQLFLGLKGKENSAEVRREYHLISLNRNVRWMYYLMKWFDRSVTKGSPERQHLDDLDSHINGAYRAINELKGGSYDFNEVKNELGKIKERIT